MPFDLAFDVRWGSLGRSGGEWPEGGAGECLHCGRRVELAWFNALAYLSEH